MRILLFFCLTFLPLVLFSQERIERMEPPNWWTNMKNPEVQLMLYGQDIAQLTPTTKNRGVEIVSVETTDNPNYLFINVRIRKTAKAGKVIFHFKENGKKVTKYTWHLWERTKPGEAHQGFTAADVMYLITPDRFANGDRTNDAIEGMKEAPNRTLKGGRHGGDIEGIRQHLDYIQDMGFTSIWLNPLLENDMKEYSYHGYSTTDFYRVDPRFGTNESYRALSEAAAARGISLIMDMIVNHIGLYHWWMKDLPASDWINTWDEYTQTNHRKTVLQDPHASEIDRKTFTDGWFVPTMPDLNQRNDFLANYLIQNGIWWIEYLHLAGIRMDTYPYPDMDYMTEWTRRIMEEYPNFNVVGEEWFYNPAIVSYWQQGKNNPNGYTSSLKSLMDFLLQVATIEALQQDEGWSTGWMRLYETLALDFLYPSPHELVVFPDNHDMSRIFTQVNEDIDLYKMAITYFLTTRGVPQIYYGTEVLMHNAGTSDHGIIRSDFPGGWAGDTINAFTGVGLSAQQKSAQAFMKKLLHWRKTATAIHNGKLTHFLPQNGVYVYFRYNAEQTVMVLMNKNDTSTSVEMKRFEEILPLPATATNVLTNEKLNLKTTVEVPPRTALVLEITPQ